MVSFKLPLLALAGVSHCSADDVDSRIVGGEKVDANVYPWFARAYFFPQGGSWGGCGGSLVTPEYVLTAAHCIKFLNRQGLVDDNDDDDGDDGDHDDHDDHGDHDDHDNNDGFVEDREEILRLFGGYQIGALCDPYGPDSSSNCDQAVESFRISDITLHPEYNVDTFDNDFALIRLSSRSSITPVAMDQAGISQGYEDLPSKDNLWPIGFGRLFSGGPLHLNCYT